MSRLLSIIYKKLYIFKGPGIMSETQIKTVMMKFMRLGNAMSRYIKCDNLIEKLAQKGFSSEEALFKFLIYQE